MIVNDLLLILLPLVTIGIIVVWFVRFLGREGKGRLQIRMRTLMAVMTAAAILAAGGVYERNLILLALFSFFVVSMLWLLARLLGKSERDEPYRDCSPFTFDVKEDEKTIGRE